ncbi:MAG: hypothetical protein GY719_26020 [bacterium]|nr:hypothetical protein [bacterium]
MAWSKGIAEWVEGETAYLSVAFTWHLDDVQQRAAMHRALGRRVVAGGPALFHPRMRAVLEGFAEIEADYPDAIAHHNPEATIASRGCPVGCWFCIVPAMEGREFTLLPDFPVRPILCDNNLSALPADYQDHIISRYVAEGVPLLDANSGFEPRTFTEEVYRRWKLINQGPWRFAFDDQAERADVQRVMGMLQAEPASKKRVYVLIGNEPFEACMERIQEVIGWGGQPHVQPFVKLTAREKAPHARFDWTAARLRDVARWANRFLWRSVPFEEYDRASADRASRAVPHDAQQGLFETRPVAG